MDIIKTKYNFLNYAIALFFLSSPIESIAIFEGFSIAKLSALVVLLGWMTVGFKTTKSGIIKQYIILALYATLTILWTIDKSNTIHQVMYFLWPSIILATAMNYSIKCNNDIYLYLKAYLIGCLIAVVSTFFYRDAALAAAEYAGQERLTAFGQDQNTLAFLLCVGFTILIDYYRKSNRTVLKLFSIALMLAFIVIILSTGSRTGLILTLFVFGLYFLSSGSFKNFILILLLIIFLSPIIYNYIPESIWARFIETEELVESGNFSERGYIWTAGINAIFKENFIVGVGYANFSTMLNKHFGWQMASHNTYLSYFCDLGVIGFIIFLLILYRQITLIYRMYKIKNDIFIFAYIIPFLVVMFVLETEYKRWIFIYGILIESYYRINYANDNI